MKQIQAQFRKLVRTNEAQRTGYMCRVFITTQPPLRLELIEEVRKHLKIFHVHSFVPLYAICHALWYMEDAVTKSPGQTLWLVNSHLCTHM